MSLPAGIYRISRWPGGSNEQGSILTLKDNRVTLLPPGEVPERDQEVTVAFDKPLVVTNECLLTVASRGPGGRQSRHPDPRRSLAFPVPFLWRGGRGGQGDRTWARFRLSDSRMAHWTCTAVAISCTLLVSSPSRCFASLIVNFFVHELAEFESLIKISSLLFPPPIFSRPWYAIPIQP